MTRRLRAVSTLLLAATFGVVSSGAAHAAYDEYWTYFNSDATDSQIPWHDTKWVPQGLTKWGEDRLVISYYDYTGESNSRVAVTDRASGDLIKWFSLDTKGHVGGLAMTSEYFWVANEGSLRRYSRAALGTKSSGDTLYDQATTNVAGNASYAYAQGETVWVGNFNWDTDLFSTNCPEYDNDPDWMYQYRVNEDGSLTYLQDRRTPGAAQGVVVTAEKLIWSTSCGRDNDSRIIVWNKDYAYDANWDHGNVILAPNMSEGIVLANGRLHVVFESSSDKYNGTADGDAADVISRRVHNGSIPPY